AWFQGFVAFPPLDPVLFEMALHASPQIFIDDRRMLSGECFALVDDLAPENSVLQLEVKGAARKPLAAIGAPIRRRATFADDARSGEIIPEGAHRSEFKIAPKDVAHSRRFRFVDDEFAFLDVVAERRLPAHPHALLFRRGDLVADSLSCDLALELGEGEQHVEREATHAGRRIERLRNRHERYALCVEDLDDLGEISQRSRQAIDLVDHDDVNLAGPYVIQ